MWVETFYVYFLVLNIRLSGEIHHKVCWSYKMYTIYFRGERCYICLFLLGAYDLMFEIYVQFL